MEVWIIGQVLDCGCGLKPRCDWNVDLFLDSTHRRGGHGPTLDTSSIPNFVNCDARDMCMFTDRMFPVVRCHQLMEHVSDWWVLLKELWRVCDKHLIIEVPDRRYLKFPNLRRSRTHISNFDAKTLEKAIPLVLGTRDFEVTTRYRSMFHKLLPFPQWPSLVRVDVYR